MSCSASSRSLALTKSSMPRATSNWPAVTVMPPFSARLPDGHLAGDRQGGGRHCNLVTVIALLMPHFYQTHETDTISTW